MWHAAHTSGTCRRSNADSVVGFADTLLNHVSETLGIRRHTFKGINDQYFFFALQIRKVSAIVGVGSLSASIYGRAPVRMVRGAYGAVARMIEVNFRRTAKYQGALRPRLVGVTLRGPRSASPVDRADAPTTGDWPSNSSE